MPMLYKHPGSHEIWGHTYELLVCKDDEVETYLQKGWHLTPDEAREKKPYKPKPKPKKDEPVIKSVKVNLNAETKKKRLFKDLTDEEKLKIAKSKLTVSKLIKKFNTTKFTIGKIRKLKNELDKKTTD